MYCFFFSLLFILFLVGSINNYTWEKTNKNKKQILAHWDEIPLVGDSGTLLPPWEDVNDTIMFARCSIFHILSLFFIALLYLCINMSVRAPVCLPAEFYSTHIEYIDVAEFFSLIDIFNAHQFGWALYF